MCEFMVTDWKGKEVTGLELPVIIILILNNITGNAKLCKIG